MYPTTGLAPRTSEPCWPIDARRRCGCALPSVGLPDSPFCIRQRGRGGVGLPSKKVHGSARYAIYQILVDMLLFSLSLLQEGLAMLVLFFPHSNIVLL